MKYNLKAIGKRIKKERVAAGLKIQGQLAEKLGYSIYSRQVVGNWENGKTMPCLNDMLSMCEIFNCELGYLLCEYDCKTRKATDIQQTTGLSENAIKSLSNIKHTYISEVLRTLSKIIEHKDFIPLLMAIHLHIVKFNKNWFRIDEEDSKTISKVMNCQPQDVKNYMQASSKSHIEATIMKIIDDLK